MHAIERMCIYVLLNMDKKFTKAEACIKIQRNFQDWVFKNVFKLFPS